MLVKPYHRNDGPLWRVEGKDANSYIGFIMGARQAILLGPISSTTNLGISQVQSWDAKEPGQHVLPTHGIQKRSIQATCPHASAGVFDKAHRDFLESQGSEYNDTYHSHGRQAVMNLNGLPKCNWDSYRGHIGRKPGSHFDRKLD